MRKASCIAIMILLIFTVSCASTPKEKRIEEFNKKNKEIEKQIMGEGIRNFVGHIPLGKVSTYMSNQEYELFNIIINSKKNSKGSVISEIWKEKDIISIIIDADNMYPRYSYIPRIECYVMLDKVATVLMKYNRTMIFISGNNLTLSSGAIYKLSHARAVSLGELLIGRGVNGMRINSFGIDDYVSAPFLDKEDNTLSIVIIPIAQKKKDEQ